MDQILFYVLFFSVIIFSPAGCGRHSRFLFKNLGEAPGVFKGYPLGDFINAHIGIAEKFLLFQSAAFLSRC